MKLSDIAERLTLTTLTPELRSAADSEVTAGYASDLLSDVLANAPAGGLLVTIQVHLNVIAVSVHAGVSGVIFASGRRPEESVRRRAVEEGIQLFASEDSAFDVTGKLYALGLRGAQG